jgi:hypothetical protein
MDRQRLYNTMAKRKRTKDKQRYTKHKTKDRETRTPIKPGGGRRCSGRVGSSCSISGTGRVSLITNQVIRHERGKPRSCLLRIIWRKLVISVQHQMSIFFSYIVARTSYIRCNTDLRFVLDQYAESDIYNGSSLKQLSACRHVAPLGHISWLIRVCPFSSMLCS